jgi:hypothetical protein
MMTKTMKIGNANGLPTNPGKSEIWIHPLITLD